MLLWEISLRELWRRLHYSNFPSRTSTIMGLSGQKDVFLNALSQATFLRNLETHAALCGATGFSKFSSATNCVLSQACSRSCQTVLKNNAVDTMLCQRTLSLLVFKGSAGQPHLWPCLETVLPEKSNILPSL